MKIYLAINTAKKTIVPQYRKGKRRAFNIEEKEAIYKAYDIFDDFEKAFIMTLYYTGLRRGEALVLQKKDFMFEEGYIMGREKVDVLMDIYTDVKINNAEIKVIKTLHLT